jgi:hypothetical protein
MREIFISELNTDGSIPIHILRGKEKKNIKEFSDPEELV